VVSTDIHGQTDLLGEFLKDGAAPVHLIVDLSDVKEIGLGLGDLKSVAVKTYDQVGWMAVVAPNPVFRFFASIGIQMSRGKYRIFANHDEAIKFLVEQDPTLETVLSGK